MKPSRPHVAATLLLSATLPSLVQANVSHGGPASFPDGQKPEYVKARSELDPSWVNWDLAVCNTPEPGRKYDRYGCCLLPKQSTSWQVTIEGPLDDHCVDLKEAGGIPMEWRISKGTTTPNSATALFYTTREANQKKGDAHQHQLSITTPVCLVDGGITIGVDPPGTKKGPFDEESTWLSGFVPLRKKGDKSLGKALALTPVDPAAGGPWFSFNCKALADKIRKGQIPYPPKNRFALKARGK